MHNGEKIAKSLHFRLKDNEKLTALISRIRNTKEEYYKTCKKFEGIYTEQVILQDIENYYKNPQKEVVLKNELEVVHSDLFQSKKRHELSINGYNEHADFMIGNIVSLAPPQLIFELRTTLSREFEETTLSKVLVPLVFVFSNRV